MNAVHGRFTTPGVIARPAQSAWWGHLLWVVAAALLGMLVAAVFAGLFQLPRGIYLLFYVGLVGTLLAGYVRWSGIELRRFFGAHWGWGLAIGAVVSVFTVQTVLMQPPSPPPQGLELIVDLAWLGLVYGAIDGLLLSVLPVYATWRALETLGWTNRWPGRIAAGLLAILASMLVIGLYHVGYPEFRGTQVLIVIVGVAIQSLGYLLARSPLAPIISHAAMHIAAVVYGINSVSQLPPHY